MTARRRNESLDLNFDGLTDAVTNLAGSLILLVLLVMGLTAPRSPGAMPKPHVHQEKSVDELQRRAAELAITLQGTSEQVRQLETEVEALATRLAELQRPPAAAPSTNPTH
jgi:TolA-binding protein